MLIKPLSFLLVLVLSIFNFIVLVIPVLLLLSPILYVGYKFFIIIGLQILFVIIFAVTFLMLIYLFLDYIFGFGVRYYTKNAVPIKEARAVAGQEYIIARFEWLKKRFNLPKARLYIETDSQVANAYAIGSMRKKSVTITLKLLNDIYENSSSKAQYVDSVAGVLGHELSHLANSDYLPGLMVEANEMAVAFLSKIFRFLFLSFANILRIIPLFGSVLSQIMVMLYNLFYKSVNFFYKLIFKPIYVFLQKFISRSVEYRCDRQSAEAFGGTQMASALSSLGGGSYFSIFSTHPRTKSRIKKVKMIKPKAGLIKPNILTSAANLLSILMLVTICVFSYKVSQFDKIGYNFNKYFIIPVEQQFSGYKHKANNWVYEIKQIINKLKN